MDKSKRKMVKQSHYLETRKNSERKEKDSWLSKYVACRRFSHATYDPYTKGMFISLDLLLNSTNFVLSILLPYPGNSLLPISKTAKLQMHLLPLQFYIHILSLKRVFVNLIIHLIFEKKNQTPKRCKQTFGLKFIGWKHWDFNWTSKNEFPDQVYFCATFSQKSTNEKPILRQHSNSKQQ